MPGRPSLPAALSAVTAVLLVAGLAATRLVAGDDGPAGARPVIDGPPPPLASSQGVPLTLAGEAPFDVAHLAVGDPTVLVVVAGQEAAPVPGPCSLVTTIRVLSQDATTVHVGVYTYRTVRPLGPGEGCTGEGRPPARLRVRLGVPLAGRTVISGEEGPTVTVVDPTVLLTATDLPDGYAARGELSLQRSGPQRSVVSSWAHRGPAEGVSLVVVQGSPVAVEPTGGQQVLARLRVRGRDAAFTQTAGFTDVRCLRWREQPDLAVAVCSTGSPVAPLDVDALRRVAEGLRRG